MSSSLNDLDFSIDTSQENSISNESNFVDEKIDLMDSRLYQDNILDENTDDEDFSDEDDEFSDEDDMIFSPAPDTIIDSNKLTSQHIVEMDSLEHQLEHFQQAGYQFENPHREEDDRWYKKFVEGEADFSDSTDEDNDLSYGFPTSQQLATHERLQLEMKQDPNHPLHDYSDQHLTNSNLIAYDEMSNQSLLALPDPTKFQSPFDETTTTTTSTPTNRPSSLPIDDRDKQGVQEMVTKQLLVAASLHSLEMAALNLRVQPREVQDVNNLDFHERQTNLQRQKIKDKLQEREKKQFKEYQNEQEIIAQAEAQGMNPDEALILHKMQKKRLEENSFDASGQTKILTPEQQVLNQAMEQLALLDEIKPKMAKGQLEFGVNIFHLFHFDYTITPYLKHLQSNSSIQHVFQSLQIDFNQFISNILTVSPAPSPASSTIPPQSKPKPFQLLSSLHIPPQYAHVSHMVNSQKHFTSLPRSTIQSTTLPSISTQLSSMLLMKEIQRTGIISTKLTLYHIIDMIIRICDEDFYSFMQVNVDQFYSQKSHRELLQSAPRQKKEIHDDHDNDVENTTFIDTSTTTSTALTKTLKEQSTNPTSLLSKTISEFNTSQSSPFNPKKHSLGREILSSVLTSASSSPLQSTTPQQRSALLNQVYLECILLREVLASSWKCHDEQYNQNATEMFQNNKTTGETPYFISPQSTPSSLSTLLMTDFDSDDESVSKPELLSNPTAVPPLPLWFYCVSNNTIMVIMLLLTVYDTFIDLKEESIGSTSANFDIEPPQYIRYLNLTPPPTLTISTMNQDYDTEMEQHDAHITLIDNIVKTKQIIRSFLIENIDPDDISSLSTTTTASNDPSKDSNLIHENLTQMPLLLVSDWADVHKATSNYLFSFFSTRFPQLVLPTVPIQVPFLVISMLNNDAEDKAAVRKKRAIEAIRQSNKNTNETDNTVISEDLNQVTIKTTKKGSKSIKGKGSNAPIGNGKKRLQKSKEDQKLATAESNLWKESYTSTGQDSEEQIDKKMEKTAAFEKQKLELEGLLQSSDEYSIEELVWLYKHQDFLYPWSFPFTPKLPMIPCSSFQHNTISKYFSQQLDQWQQNRDQMVKFIEYQQKLIQQKQSISTTPTPTPPLSIKSTSTKLKVKATNKLDDAINNLDDDDDESNNQNAQEFNSSTKTNTDEETDHDNVNNTPFPTMENMERIELPRISTITTSLPNENFSNLTVSSLLDLCQQGSEQYKQHLQRQRTKLLQERGGEAFTEHDMNNLQLFPNSAADNAYSYVRSKQQKLEERQERRKRRKQLKEQRKQKLAEKIAHNQAVGLDDAVGSSSRLDLLELKSSTTMISDDSNSDSLSSDQTTTDEEVRTNKLLTGGSGSDDFSPSSTDVSTSDDDTKPQNSSPDDANNPKKSNKRLIETTNSSQVLGHSPDQPIAKAPSSSTGSKTYNKLPVSLTLLEHQSIGDVMGIDNPSVDFQYTSGLNSDITATSFSAQNGSNLKQNKNDNEPFDTKSEDPNDPRNVTNISRSGLLLFPLVQTIPFAFDSIAQIASYTPSASSSGSYTPTVQFETPRNHQPRPLRYFAGKWIVDSGVLLQDKSICLFPKEWYR